MPKSKELIFLVDDNPVIQKLYQKLLQDDFEIQTFSLASELEPQLKITCPSLILIDWLLPELDGILLTKKIRKLPSFDHVPIAILTANTPNLKNVKTIFKAGAQCFIYKESPRAILLGQIYSLISNYKVSMSQLNLRSELVSIFKHDINNILTGVITGLELMGMDETISNSSAIEDLSMIQESSFKLKSLIEDLGFVFSSQKISEYQNKREIELRSFLLECYDELKAIHPNIEFDLSISQSFNFYEKNLKRSFEYMLTLFNKWGSKTETIIIFSDVKSDHLLLGVKAESINIDNLSEQINFNGLLNPNGEKKDLLPIHYSKACAIAHKGKLNYEKRGEFAYLYLEIPFHEVRI